MKGNGITTKQKQVQEVDAPVNTTAYADAWGRVLAVDPADGPGVNYTYDAVDRLVGADYGMAQTTMTYDLAGRKTTMTDADMGAWAYAYDALGNLTGQTDANGCETSLSYDRLNRLTGKSFGTGCPATGSVTYAWDGVQYLSRTQTAQAAGQKGYRTGMLDGSGYTNWTYDARGRVVNEEKTIGTRSFETDWTYNSADLAASMVYPADENNQREVVSYHYLPQKLLYSLTGDAAYVESSQYDEAGRLTRRALGARDATQAPLAVQYQYAGWGPDANANDDYYDGQGRLMSITSGTENAPGALLDLSYRYDIQGNITQITDANLGPQTQSFGYDALDRIVSAQAVGGSLGTYSESYSYDSEGRLVSKNGVTYTYNPEEFPFHAVGSLSDGKSYEYDANGSMTTRVIGTESYTLLYDGALRMVAVQNNSATIASFGYDGDGQMVSASMGGVTTSYVGGYFEWQTSASGSVAVKYYSAGSAKIAMRRAGVVTYLLGDHLGSTSVVFDDSTNGIQRQGYRPFGEKRYPTGPSPLPTDYQYTGQRGFEEIGLYFYNARWYDGALGRFAQADTVVPEDTQGVQAWDRYAYVNNDPINATDPTGHFLAPVLIGAGVGALISGAVNIVEQVRTTGQVSNLNAVIGAAAGGAVSGALLSIAPITGIAAAVGYGAISNVLSNQTTAAVTALLEPSGNGILNDFSANGGYTNGKMMTNGGEIISDAVIGGVLTGATMGAAHVLSKYINIPDPFQIPKSKPKVINLLPKNNLLNRSFELLPATRSIAVERSVTSSFVNACLNNSNNIVFEYVNQRIDQILDWN